jgi:Tfp pilus assembly protein PilO
MNKNLTPLILIVLAVGIYFTFTRVKIDELQSIRQVNAQYEQALKNSEKLVKVRDSVRDNYNKISQDDQERLEKILPDNVDNVRLIIDVSGVAARHGIVMKNVKTTTPKDASEPVVDSGIGQDMSGQTQTQGSYSTVTLSFDVSSNYQNFLNFLKDIEASLRIIEVSKITIKSTETGVYDYNVEIKTFWLKQ